MEKPTSIANFLPCRMENQSQKHHIFGVVTSCDRTQRVEERKDCEEERRFVKIIQGKRDLSCLLPHSGNKRISFLDGRFHVLDKGSNIALHGHELLL